MKKNQKKTEEVAKEQVSTEIKEPQTEQTNSNIYVLNDGNSHDDFDTKVEEGRNKIYTVYRSTSKRNTIIMIVVAAVFVAAFLLLPQGQWGQIVGWVLVGVTLAGLVTYYLLTRNIYPKTSKDYFRVFWFETNAFVFDQEGFSNCTIDNTEKYDMASVLVDRVYKDVVAIASRNIVHGKYNGLDFEYGELALYKASTKKGARDVMFVGRHISFDTKIALEDRILINIRKAETPLDLPNDIEDLKPVIEQNLFVVYAKEGVDPNKVLGEELLNNLKSIECVGSLVNVNIVFWHKKVMCYLSYDDVIAAVPFEKPINKDAYVALKKNVKDVFDILAK